MRCSSVPTASRSSRLQATELADCGLWRLASACRYALIVHAFMNVSGQVEGSLVHFCPDAEGSLL
eukprot:3849011-Amphidinium_carterae.2